MKIIHYILLSPWYLLSLLPLKCLYLFADLLFIPLYHWVGYRRPVVHKNLKASFPDKSEKEIQSIEKSFYHFLCDYFVETFKLLSISKKEMKQRMTFSGTDEIAAKLNNRTFCFVYLGHYGNWEWIASLPYWMPADVLCAQIYHPLYNKTFDKLFLHIRNQFGGECIPMKETLRRVIELKRANQKTVIGFISDQTPKWENIHHWADFMHQDTPVFTGTERIGRKVDALIYYADVKRVKRGHYHCSFHLLTDNIKQMKENEPTDLYIRLLQQMINEQPAYWLWSHNRWKRTRAEWQQRQENRNKE